MAQYRPAGLSDNEQSDDDFAFLDRPKYAIKARNVEEENRKRCENRLTSAILVGDVDVVEKVITEDFNNSVEFKFSHGWTPLLEACLHGQYAIIKLLLDKGANPKAHNDSITPIMLLCSNTSAKDEDICRAINILIEKGSILNMGDRHGTTPLMRAIKSGRIAAVKLLLENNINIEMRDEQGWTAVFWAVYKNQPEILELLILQGARFTVVDTANRTPLELAYMHEYDNIITILRRHLNLPKEEVGPNINDISPDTSWHAYYSGLRNDDNPLYWKEVSHLLYGMSCEHLEPVLLKNKVGLKEFLLWEEEDMIKSGIELEYERRRIIMGLRSFLMRNWKLNAVDGLYSQQLKNYSVADCLAIMGSHLLQFHVLEATLQFTAREFNKMNMKLKSEPPDSPVLAKLRSVNKKLNLNIKRLKKEAEDMRNIHVKILSKNPRPTGVINEPKPFEMKLQTNTRLLIAFTLGLVMYRYVFKDSLIPKCLFQIVY